MEIVMEVEERFGIEIEDGEAPAVATVGEAIALVSRKCGGENQVGREGEEKTKLSS